MCRAGELVGKRVRKWTFFITPNSRAHSARLLFSLLMYISISFHFLANAIEVVRHVRLSSHHNFFFFNHVVSSNCYALNERLFRSHIITRSWRVRFNRVLWDGGRSSCSHHIRCCECNASSALHFRWKGNKKKSQCHQLFTIVIK